MSLRSLFQRKKDDPEGFVDEITIVDGQVVALATSPIDEFPTDEPLPEEKNPPDEIASNETSSTEIPLTETSYTETPSTEVPSPAASSSFEPSSFEPSSFEQPSAELPSAETPAMEIPSIEIPAAEIPLATIPEEEEQYPPCYLTDGAGEDYDNFLEHLKQEGKTKGTQAEYGVNLRHWRVALSRVAQSKLSNGHGLLSIKHLNEILQSVSSVKALRMKYSLSAYARYRRKQGDPRLFFLLTEHAEDIFTPSRTIDPEQERNPNDRLTKEEMVSYEDLGRYLCRKGRREGIWVSLCLLGIKPCEVKELAFPNKSSVGFMRRGKPRIVKIPHWLYKAMQEMPEEKWRLNRRVVYRDVSALGANPRTLNAAAREREQEEAQRKKAEQRDIQRMVKQWRRSRKK